MKCIHASHTSSSQVLLIHGVLYSLHYLVPSSKDGGFASQAKTDGTNDARLAGSISSNNHVQIWSRAQFSVVIGPVKRNVNMRQFTAVILKRAPVKSNQETSTMFTFLCV